MKADEHYDAVAQELIEGRIQPGVWARSLAESDGNKEQAKAAYIRYRVAQLSEDKRALKQAELAQSASASWEKLRPVRRFAMWCLVFLGALILITSAGKLIVALVKWRN